MDEGEKQYFDGLIRLTNTKLDDIPEKLFAIRVDTLSQRITKLEEELRGKKP